MTEQEPEPQVVEEEQVEVAADAAEEPVQTEAEFSWGDEEVSSFQRRPAPSVADVVEQVHEDGEETPAAAVVEEELDPEDIHEQEAEKEEESEEEEEEEESEEEEEE